MSRVHEEFDTAAASPSVSDRLRETMPATAEAKDLFVGLFGDGVRVIYAEEAGQVIKAKVWKPDSEYRAALTPSQFIRIGEMGDEYYQAMTEAKKSNGK